MAAAAALVVVVAVAAVAVASPGDPQLDVNAAQAGVQQILLDPIKGYGVHNVSDVVCNNGHNPTAKHGNSFTCQATIDGTKRNVNVVITDDAGTYEVDRPQ